jgi:glycosyltransferase involved in cell wall biosynthesis
MLLSYVFSFRNEEENIPELVRRVAAVSNNIDDCNYEMIFVNDASSDNSLELLIDLQRSHPITVLNMSRRFGVTPCVLAGLAVAKGDAVVYMDSDLQDPPELVSEMVEKFRNGAEVVHTTRTHRDGEGPLKMWATKKAYALINYFSEIDLPGNTGDYKLLSSKVVKKILELKEYDPYLRGLSVWVGFKQDFVYYRRDPRFRGETKFPLLSKGPIREFTRGLTAYSAAPLLISFALGLITSALSVILILWAMVTKLIGIAAPGASGVLIAIGFFSGAILMSNGIVGIYISKIYSEVKGRPRYIVESMIEPNGCHSESKDT